MWIQYTKTTSTGRPAVSSLTVDGERIDFSDNGKANVTAGLGERLVAQSDHIVAAGDAADDADDDSSESDAAERTDSDDREPADGDDADGPDADSAADADADADDNGDS